MQASRLLSSSRTADPTWSILDTLDVHVTVLDRDGTILQTNRAWDDFAAANPRKDGSAPRNVGIGANYLDICRAAVGFSAESAYAAYRGIRDVLGGKKRHFKLDYPCHSTVEQRWFSMTVSPCKGSRPRQVVVTHTDVTALKRAELETHRKTQELTHALEKLENFAGRLKASLLLDQSIRIGGATPGPDRESGGREHAGEERRRLGLLSEREREVLTALARGERVADIARRLSLSAKSVSTYRSRILEKLQVRTTAGLVAFMARIGAL